MRLCSEKWHACKKAYIQSLTLGFLDSKIFSHMLFISSWIYVDLLKNHHNPPDHEKNCSSTGLKIKSKRSLNSLLDAKYHIQVYKLSETEDQTVTCSNQIVVNLMISSLSFSMGTK